MADSRILLVDDDEIIRLTLSTLLSRFGFSVTTAGSVAEALRLIHSETFEVLISDLHLPGSRDGLTVVSAMRHANARTITMLLSAFPEIAAAAQAILPQADEILVKPMEIIALVSVIRQRLASGPNPAKAVESVTIVEQSAQKTNRSWLNVGGNQILTSSAMSSDLPAVHLP